MTADDATTERATSPEEVARVLGPELIEAAVRELEPEIAAAASRAEGGTAGDADPDTGDEEPLPSFSEQLADQLGGLRGIIESGIPVVVFVVANVAWSLRPAVVISVVSALAIAGWRLARRQPIRHAINGLFGIAIGAVIAWRTGSAKDFYLPGILLSLAYGLAMLASVVIRRPLVGWVWSLLAARGSTAWRDNPRLVRTFNWLTVVWALTYLAKTLVQAIIFQNTSAKDPGTTLGIARLALGYPPYALLLAITVWAVRRVAPPVELDAEAPAGAEPA